mgnify:CR=1 FL=1
MEEIVRVKDLSFRYPDGTSLRFEGEDFAVHKGERVVMLGPNGSGKSTLLSLLLGLLGASGGEIDVMGVDPGKDYEKVRERIGALLQNPDLQIIAPKVWDDVSFSPRNYGYGKEKTDELFEHIDPMCRTEMIRLLNSVNHENGTAILLSTHNMNTVPLIADTVYLMAVGGRIVAKGTPKEVFSMTGALAECHIEPPVLGELFAELKKLGVDLDPSLTVEEAALTIANHMLSSEDKAGHG